MGKITLITDEMPSLLPMQGRSEGVHISTVIHDLCIRLGHFKGDLDPNQAWFELGNALEWAIIQRMEREFPGRYIQPGELELNGLYGTPDLWDLDEWLTIEIKCAWMSSKHQPDDDKFWRYWTQVKAYCKMAGMDRAHLYVTHINGDYTKVGPDFRVWEQVFTQEELDENWAMLVTTGQRLESEGGK